MTPPALRIASPPPDKSRQQGASGPPHWEGCSPSLSLPTTPTPAAHLMIFVVLQTWDNRRSNVHLGHKALERT